MIYEIYLKIILLSYKQFYNLNFPHNLIIKSRPTIFAHLHLHLPRSSQKYLYPPKASQLLFSLFYPGIKPGERPASKANSKPLIYIKRTIKIESIGNGGCQNGRKR